MRAHKAVEAGHGRKRKSDAVHVNVEVYEHNDAEAHVAKIDEAVIMQDHHGIDEEKAFVCPKQGCGRSYKIEKTLHAHQRSFSHW